jgi:hypothetical protein
MLVDVHSGFAPPEWQSYVGPILAYRPQHHHFLGTQIGDQSDVQHFNSLDGEIVWDFMSNILDRFGEAQIPVADRDFTFEKLRDFTESYCLNDIGEAGNYQGTEGQNITLGEF